jgi:LacI family transcriptional regulator
MTAPIKRATSHDVARVAGVSQTTVSLVLNDVDGTASVAPATRRRVHEAVDLLDYHPHEGARSLHRKATHILGVAIPDAGNPHYLEVVDAIEAVAQQRGYSMVLLDTKYDLARERQFLQWLKQRQMDALILTSCSGKEIEGELRAAYLRGYNVASFTIDGSLEPGSGDVALEPGSGERQLLEHLVGLGHRRIGYIYGAVNQELWGKRLHDCLALQRGLGLPVEERWVCRCGPTAGDSYRATQALLEGCASDDLPTALIVANDLLAVSVMAALHGRRIAIPEQMSVAAFDNTYLAQYLEPPLTSVDPNAREMGTQIARLTLDRLAAPGSPPARPPIASRLVVRASTGLARQT